MGWNQRKIGQDPTKMRIFEYITHYAVLLALRSLFKGVFRENGEVGARIDC